MVAHSVIIQSGTLYGNLVELLPKQLYFTSFTVPPQKSDSQVRYVDLDNRVHYEPFYGDFGPLNLSVLYRCTKYLHGLVETNRKRRIVVYTNNDERNRVNGAYIMGSYLIIYHGVSADTAYLRLEHAEPPKYIGYRDAALGEPTYLLHLHDVLRAVEKALRLKWFDVTSFDVEEYELYERVENGDMNWIIPGKILSFCGPHNESRIEDGYPYHSPETYFDYFRATNVTTIVRLNIRMYDARKFTEAGFEHVDLFFIDGSTPSERIVENFMNVVDNAKGAVAVHCKAGLGRTGTLIACWMMKEFGLNAAECMAWLRICRPGSVIGPQQEYLVSMQKYCWALSQTNVVQKARRRRVSGSMGKKTLGKLACKVDKITLSHPVQSIKNGANVSHRPRPNILPVRGKLKKSTDKNGNTCLSETTETSVDSFGRSQGDQLLVMKARSQHASRNTHSTNTSVIANNNPPNEHPLQNVDGQNSDSVSQNTKSLVSTVHSNIADTSAVSPRFSSPTTPIKPLSTPKTISTSAFGARSSVIRRNIAVATHSQPRLHLIIHCTRTPLE